MNYILFVILVTTANRPTMTTQSFNNEVNCLQAISKLIDVEKKLPVTIKAFCVKE